MLACDLNGHVHAWGTNSSGQLGVNIPYPDSNEKTVIDPCLITGKFQNSFAPIPV